MDERESAGTSPAVAGGVSSTEPGAHSSDRVFLLECRLEQLASALTDARAEADRARARLAEVAAREGDYVRRDALRHDELAAARSEVVGLHRRLEHSEALRAELEGHLFESGARDDAAELLRLRRDVVSARERAIALDGALTHLRIRVEELVGSRDTLLTRFAEWQHSLAKGDTDAVDLAEFIAGLRGEILELEQHSLEVERREADLREQLERGEGSPRSSGVPSSRADTGAAVRVPDVAFEDRDAPTLGVDPPAAASPTDARVAPHVSALSSAAGQEGQIAMLNRLGRSGDPEAFPAIRRSTSATEPLVRAAAYEALGRLLRPDPSRLEPLLRRGLADPDPRVRRRVVLTAAAARGLALAPLLEPAAGDPDPQVRRVAARVLRSAPRDSGLAAASAPVGAATTGAAESSRRRRR